MTTFNANEAHDIAAKAASEAATKAVEEYAKRQGEEISEPAGGEVDPETAALSDTDRTFMDQLKASSGGWSSAGPTL